MIRQTYANAGLDYRKDRCQFFEAHGTGTPAGDPIEARAVYEAFFGDSLPGLGSSDTMFIGSVKTAIGHLEGCAGLAGLIKALEAVRRGVIPPNMLFEHLNPAIKPFSGNLRIPTEAAPWPVLPPNSPRRASVNSFGFGGTNAHAIIESFDNSPRIPEARSASELIPTPLVLSANSERSLRNQVVQLCSTLQAADGRRLEEILFTMAKRRSQLPFRAFFSGHNLESLRKKLEESSEEDAAIAFYEGEKPPGRPGRILGVFTGQGAQWPTMGREILQTSAFARNLMARLEQSLASLPEPPTWTLSEQILADPTTSRLSEAEISQPLCAAVQLMLVELLRRAGVTFDSVIGHSSGEIVAAYAAGFLTAEDAIRVAYCRGICAKLARGENGQSGAMMAVGMSYDEAAELCRGHFPGRIDVAASNAPSSTTLSGDKDAIDEAKALLDEQGTFARVLKVDTAYHSHHMQPCAEPYLDLLKACDIRPLPGNPSCGWFSSVLGERIDASAHAGILAGEYWKANMVKPVLFTIAAELTADDAVPCHLALEVGPHPALKGPFGQTYERATGARLPYQGTLARNTHDVEALSDTLGFLWSRLGKAAVNFVAYAQSFSAPSTTMAISLPSYPWDHTQSFWKESRKSRNFRQRTQPPHPLLGVRSSEDAALDMRWLNTLRLSDVPWLEGHKVEGQVIYPAAAYLVMAMESAKAIDETRDIQLVELYDVSILSAIQLSQDDSQGVEILFTLKVNDTQSDLNTAQWACFTSSAGSDGSWKCHAKGQLRVEFGSSTDNLLPSRSPPVASLKAVDMERFYASLTQIGLDYTGNFKHLDSVVRQSGFATATAKAMGHDFSAMIHPALLDSAFQSLFAAYCWPDDGSLHAPFLPTFFKSLRLINMNQVQHGEQLIIDSYLTEASGRDITADIDIFTCSNCRPLLQLQGLTCTSLLRAGPSNCKELYTRTEWEVDISSAIASTGLEHHDALEDLELVDLCERLSYSYLRELNKTIDRTEVVNMEWHFQRIFDWIDHLFPIIEAGQHPTISKEWSADQRPWLLEQAAKFPDQVDLLLIQAVGENLSAVVRKQTTMLEHMIKDDVLNRFYKFGLGFQRANGYLGRISRQIAHRYPRMNILEIGAGTGGATKGILESLGTTFQSYTFTDISTGFFEAAAEAFEPWLSKMVFKPLNVENDPTEQGFKEASYDFIVASNVLHATKSLSETMRNVRRLLKPGGQLLLLEVTSDIVRVKLMMSGLSGWWLGGDDGRRYAPTITIPEWESLLRSTGFSGVDHTVNDFVDSTKYMTSVMLSQAVDDNIDVLRQPLSSSGDWISGHSITILGGKCIDLARSISDTLAINGSPPPMINFVEGFEQLSSSQCGLDLRSVLVLEDLEEPIFQNLTSQKLSGLQMAINQSRQMLWVSKGCRRENPYANMSVGLCRSLAAEYPHIQFQHIDLESDLEPLAVSRISEAMARLVFKASLKQPVDILWSIEPELILEHGKWLIPRILPDEPLNHRLNCSKMAIETQSSLETSAIEIHRVGKEFAVTQPVPSLQASKDTTHVRVRVTLSLLYPIFLDESSCVYLCYGYREQDPTVQVLALSETNSSNICVSESCVFDCSASTATGTMLLRKVAFAMLAEKLLARVDPGATIVLHDADQFVGAAVRWKAAERGLICISTTSLAQPDDKDTGTVFIHSHAPERVIKKLLPRDAKLLIDFSSSKDHSGEPPLRRYLPACCKFYQLQTAFGGTDYSVPGIPEVVLKRAKDAIYSSLGFQLAADAPVINISELSGHLILDLHYSSVVNFCAETTVSTIIQPLKANLLLRPDRTYLLVGCTGGLGQALCRWMVSAGVRHLALTTRNVSRVDKQWLEALQLAGANIKLLELDVGDKEALAIAYDQVSREMPPICGVANAAMVLSDRSFGELEVRDFATVFRPKVQGTQNLHELFGGQQLDFFVMFSSLASIVGNRGQSNYAAANLFMSAIAEQRRAKNLAASVIHIGMILGPGYVSSTGAYEATLRQYNYMPISESDFLNMFSQAILVGQPRSGHPPELITGLNRYSQEPDVPKHFWHENARFCHHTLEGQHHESSSVSRASLSHRLADAKNSDELLSIVQEEFCTKLERMLQAESGTIRTSQPLMNLGVDSLIAVEIRSWFLKELDVDFPVLNILNTDSIADLCLRAVSRLVVISEQTESGKQGPRENEVSSHSHQPCPFANTGGAMQSLEHVPVSNGSATAESSTPPSDFDPSSVKSSGKSTKSSSTGDDGDLPVDRYSKIERSGRLSFAQERIWFLQQYLQDPTTFNVTLAYRITGPLRLADLEHAFDQVIRRHESLRTGFYTDRDTTLPTQGVHEHVIFKLEQKNDCTVRNEFETMQNVRYDFENGHVIQAVIICNPNPDEHILVLGFHHIALDGFSAQILVADLAAAYCGQELTPVPKGYLDFAVQQRAADLPVETRQYWKSEFDTLPPVLPILDFAECKTRVPLTDYKTRASEQTLSLRASAGIKAAARRLGATPFHVYLAALQALLYELASVEDVCIGIADANKNEATYMDTTGFFVNLLPLRFRLDASQTLADLIAKAKVKATEALTHSLMPFDVLLDELKLPRSAMHSPLFQVMLNFKMGSTRKIPLGDCQAEVLDFKDARNAFDITFDIENYSDGSTSISVKTQEHLYTEHELRLVLATYVRILDLFAKDPSQALSDITKPTPEDIEKSLKLGRGDRIPSPKLDTLSHYFEDWVTRQPGAVAVRDDRGTEMSYSQLKHAVGNVATTLLRTGLRSGARLCVYCEPGIHIIICLLAIAEIGGTYVPLDPQNPPKRLQLIVDNCEPDVILFDESTRDLTQLLQTRAKIINVNSIQHSSKSMSLIENQARASGSAFMFYTSGTTGIPKGVELTHHNLVHHIDSIINFYGIERGIMLQQAPLGFDMSLTQMSLSIMTGGTLLVASSTTRKDPRQLAQLMLSGKVTHTFMTPTLALALIRHGYDYLSKCVHWKFSVLSGEAMRAHVISEFQRLSLADLKVYNGYGPTEITINSSSGQDELSLTAVRDTWNPSIGFTLPNYSCYILNDDLQPVRVGHAGELVVGGAGVAVGYLQRQELTQDKFLLDPFATSDDLDRGWSRMYRTGDKAKFLPDGRIVFLGRRAGDSQIKLRGFRIELEDVSNTIIKSSGGVVSEAAVSLRQSSDGSQDSAFLVAFAIISEAHCPSEVSSFFKQLLRDLPLPRYMIPAKIVPVDQLPMSSSGKLDQYALDAFPIPQDANIGNKSLTATQEKLKWLWLEALPSVGATAAIEPDTDFFQAGGNSLRIVMLREHIARQFGVTVSVFDLFKASTLAGMAAKIDESSEPQTESHSVDWAVETHVETPSNEPIQECEGDLAFKATDGLEVVLTGATGFLGSNILRFLLNDKRVSGIHCLAIRRSSKDVEERHPLLMSPQVTCYGGDLSLPRLGLSEEEYHTLSQKVHRIIHNGADVSFLKSYQSLRSSNVMSTKELARLAAPRQIPVHFVSSGGVVNLTGMDGLPEISVSAFKPPTDGSQGYTASKWASEVYLESCVDLMGIPTWIHRPSNITGVGVPSTDLMQNLFQFSGRIRALPDISGWRGSFDFVPVEDVAQAIAASIHETPRLDMNAPFYRHHCASQKIPVGDLQAFLEAEQGVRMQIVSLDDWLSRAKEAGLDGTTALLIRSTLDMKRGTIVPWLMEGV